MVWNYTNHGQIPEEADLCLYATRCNFYIGRYYKDERKFINNDRNEVISLDDVFKWVCIDEIHENIECDNDGKYHDYEKFPAYLYVSNVNYDRSEGQTIFTLKSVCKFEIKYTNVEDDATLWQAAKERKLVSVEMRHTPMGETRIRNVKIVEDES